MKFRLLLLVPILLLVACNDPYGACEKGALDIGNGIAAGMTTVDQLRTQGLISVQEETSILGYMKFANDANGAFATCAQQAHTAGSKAGAYTACAQTFSTTLANPSELVLIKVSNPTAQQNVQVIINGITTGITGVITALGGK